MRRFSKITTTQLARICGVSQGIVDRALHNRQGISSETRKQILAVAKEYDYVPNIRNAGQTNSMLKDNVASAKTIVKNGGILENEISDGGVLVQQYWIDRKHEM